MHRSFYIVIRTSLILLLNILYVIHTYMHTYIGTITQGPMNVTYFPSEPDIQLKCTVTSGVPVWIINETAVTLSQLDNPNDNVPAGHSRNGTNIIISAPPVNNTMYVCELPLTADNSIFSDPAFVYVAGE